MGYDCFHQDYGSTTHEWAQEDGRNDIFAFTNGEYCNGPKCFRCGYGFCHHCNETPPIPDCPKVKL